MSEARLRSLLRRGEVIVVGMAEIDHPQRFIYAWSGVGLLEYQNHTYEGFGLIGSVSPIRTTESIEILEVRFGISGIDAGAIDDLHANVKGRYASFYEAYLDRHYRVAYREQLMRVRLDRPDYKVDAAGKLDYGLTGFAGMFQLLQRSAAKVSPEEARALYPDETGYDEIHLQQDLQLPWLPPP